MAPRRAFSGVAFQRTVEGVINIFGQTMQTTQRAHEISDMPPVALFWGPKDHSETRRLREWTNRRPRRGCIGPSRPKQFCWDDPN
jgi:hypothetical protein